ncbi:MAG: aspartate/glutamate racemase family protein [Phycisphaeraceae bacterium]
MTVLIACVHATPRAVGPAAAMLARRPNYRREDILEPALLEHAEAPACGREIFAQTLARAAAMRPTAILTTCSMYTRFLPAMRERLATPVLGVDEAMIEAAARGGRLALVGSIANAIEQTAGLIRERAKAAGRDVQIGRTLLVAPSAGEDGAAADEAMRQIDEVAGDVDTIVIVQLSLSTLAERLAPAARGRTLTSFDTALARLDEIVGRAQG